MNYLLRSLPGAMVAIMLTAAGLACSIPGFGNNQPVADQAGPEVAILSPTAGQQLQPGREVKIQSSSVDAEGVARVELAVDGRVVWIDANAKPEPNTPFIVAQPWLPEIPGTHVIQVRAYDTTNAAGQSEPLTVQVVAAAQTAKDEFLTATPQPEPDNPTNTPIAVIENAPTSTALSSPSPRPPQPSATATLPLPTPTATPTPGVFKPTGFEPEGRFREIWEELGDGRSRLGYPTDPAISGRDFARQLFQRGMMFWWDRPEEPDYIWVIDSPQPDLNRGETWNRYPEDWDGDDEYSCDAARSNGDKGPRRGFGKLWCARPELQRRLGNPIELEGGSGGNPPFAIVQFYQGGVMLYNPLNSAVFVLFDQGDWQRFGY